MDALQSPKSGSGLPHFEEDAYGNELPGADYIKVKCYFYTEDEDLHKEVFVEKWF